MLSLCSHCAHRWKNQVRLVIFLILFRFLIYFLFLTPTRYHRLEASSCRRYCMNARRKSFGGAKYPIASCLCSGLRRGPYVVPTRRLRFPTATMTVWYGFPFIQLLYRHQGVGLKRRSKEAWHNLLRTLGCIDKFVAVSRDPTRPLLPMSYSGQSVMTSLPFVCAAGRGKPLRWW